MWDDQEYRTVCSHTGPTHCDAPFRSQHTRPINTSWLVAPHVFPCAIMQKAQAQQGRRTTDQGYPTACPLSRHVTHRSGCNLAPLWNGTTQDQGPREGRREAGRKERVCTRNRHIRWLSRLILPLCPGGRWHKDNSQPLPPLSCFVIGEMAANF